MFGDVGWAGFPGGRYNENIKWEHMAVCQNLVPLVNIKIAGKWMFIPLKMVLTGIDPYPYLVVLTILKNVSSSTGRIIPYIMEHHK